MDQSALKSSMILPVVSVPEYWRDIGWMNDVRAARTEFDKIFGK